MTNKVQQRRRAYDARNAQSEKEIVSQIICNKFINQPIYQQSNTVMWYLHCRSEVRTLQALTAELANSKKIVIPYCTADNKGDRCLGLWWLEDLSELVAGTWNILEPPPSRWSESAKKVLPKDIDLIMVPGVAFDRKGGRLGNGAGYYDRLLKQIGSDIKLVAVCYESQLCERVIMDKHDVYMDVVITEKNDYYAK